MQAVQEHTLKLSMISKFNIQAITVFQHLQG